MKIKGAIITIEDKGEELRLSIQGAAVRDALWRDMRVISFTVPHTKKNARAFYMGRTLTLTVTPI